MAVNVTITWVNTCHFMLLRRNDEGLDIFSSLDSLGVSL
jgi:hypothetical protein